MNLPMVSDLRARLRRKVNRFWFWYGYHHGRTRLRNHPEVFAIESTNFCNLRCIMCPRGEPDVMDRPLGHMTQELFAKILAGCHFYANPCWFHWFGEPLMNPHLFEQIAYAKAHGVPNLGISTNATLLTAERARAILDSSLDTLLIAIDGQTKETYEKIRLSSRFTFEEVTENVRRFLAMKRARGQRTPHTTVSIIIMERTRGEVDAFRRAWLEHGADEVRIKPFVVWANQTSDFVPLAVIEQQATLAGTPRAFPCQLMWESVVITWNGRVVPCCYDYNSTATLGDLNTQTLSEIWNSAPYVALREKELAGRNDTPLCRNCTQAPGRERRPHWPLARPRAWSVTPAVVAAPAPDSG